MGLAMVAQLPELCEREVNPGLEFAGALLLPRTSQTTPQGLPSKPDYHVDRSQTSR